MSNGLVLLGIAASTDPASAPAALSTLPEVAAACGHSARVLDPGTCTRETLARADVIVATLGALDDAGLRAGLIERETTGARPLALVALADLDGADPARAVATAIAGMPTAELAFAADLGADRLPGLLERAIDRARAAAPGSPQRRQVADRRDPGLATLRLLDELRLGVSPLDGMERAAGTAADIVCTVLDADLVVIAERHDERLWVRAVSDRTNGRDAARGPRERADRQPAVDPGLLRTGLEACRTHRATLHRVDDLDGRHRTLFAAPLRLGEATFCLMVRPRRVPDAATLGLAIRAAAQLRIVLGQAWLHERADRELMRSRAMLEIGNAINGPAPLDETIANVCRIVARTLDARRVLFYRVDTEAGRLLQAYGFAAPYAGAAVDEPPGLLDDATLRVTLGWRCMCERRAALVPRDAPHGGETDASIAARLSAGRGSALIAPLADAAAPTLEGALIAIRDPEADDFLPIDLDGCRRIARQLAVLIHRRELQERMEYLALNDPLTGLANRAALEMALDRRVDRARGMRRVRPFAVVFMDLDGFKHVNDSLGHETGDRLLEAVAARLSAETRPGDVLARLGGDEFAMVLDPVAGPRNAARIARRVLAVLQAPFEIDGRGLSVGASIGVSVYPRHAAESSDLVRTADAAMYDAKRGGKNAVRCFDDGLARDATRRLDLERALRAAVEADGEGLSLLYQPQVSFADGTVTGAEALMRWHHPTLGPIGPDEFIPVAEDAHLIGAMSLWLLERTWITLERLVTRAALRGDTHVPGIAVNVSPPTLEDDAFVDAVEAGLSAASLDPSLLCVELTESVVMSGTPTVVARIERLRAIGVRLSVDDFGTGWSSLRYLLGLPLDSLKIDRAFVQHVVDDPEHATLVRTLVAMAGNLGLSTVAEGIETPAQHRVLARAGCTAAQGWLHSRPLAPDTLIDFLDAHDSAAARLAVVPTDPSPTVDVAPRARASGARA